MASQGSRGAPGDPTVEPGGSGSGSGSGGSSGSMAACVALGACCSRAQWNPLNSNFMSDSLVSEFGGFH